MQTQELHRLTLGSDGTAYLKVTLEGGRRTTLASGATAGPAEQRRPMRPTPIRIGCINLLRTMAEPAYSGMSRKTMMGGGTAGPSTMQMLDGPQDGTDTEVVHQNRLTAGGARTGAEMMGEAVIASDRSKVTIHLAPVFQTATDKPEVKLSAIPGGQ